MIEKIAQKRFAIEAQEELNEGPTILKSEMVKAIKDLTRKMPPEMKIYQCIYSRNWGTVD